MINTVNATITTEKAASTAAYSTGIGTSVGGALSVNEYALWGGLALSALTFVINLIYQARRDRREAELNKLQQAALRRAEN
ncbi:MULTISPECIES: HP1 family phage holin [Shewanella]|uniref:HP1 family phage holin n=1 Tax=Shewanella TaxID=22 RepID=UPI00138F53C7|nr:MULTISPECIES: HP1 family phage holin [Shewanella]MCE9785600.1 phage holin family protein [Shewanella algae]NDO76163.1 hypothetical protein [Shewanella sp. SE1]